MSQKDGNTKTGGKKHLKEKDRHQIETLEKTKNKGSSPKIVYSHEYAE